MKKTKAQLTKLTKAQLITYIEEQGAVQAKTSTGKETEFLLLPESYGFEDSMSIMAGDAEEAVEIYESSHYDPYYANDGELVLVYTCELVGEAEITRRFTFTPKT